MKKGLIFSLCAIIIILGIVFFSQQPNFKEAGKPLISATTDKAQAYLALGSNWVNNSIISKFTGVAQKRGDAIKTQVSQQENIVSPKNISQKVESYFSGIANSIAKPGTPQNCTAVATPSK